MLPLPKHLVIERDYDEENALRAATRKHLEAADRSGIHATDLLDRRISFFKKTTHAPLPDRLLNVFMVGQTLHAIIQVVKAGSGEYTKPPEVGTRHFEDIAYTMDFLLRGDIPDEIKTTRSFYLPKSAYLPEDKTYHMYLEQLLVYMAAEDKTTGYLTILYLNLKEAGKTSPQIFVWKIITTPVALEAFRRVMTKQKIELETALATNDHTALPVCRDWKCYDCEFWEPCKPPGRYAFGQKSKKEWTA